MRIIWKKSLMRNSLIKNLVISVFVILLIGCTNVSNSPETVLWGTWDFKGVSGDGYFNAKSLSFYEDGRLLLDEQEENPARYVVIAPGRIKITRDDEAEVYNYEIIEGELRFSLDGHVQTFSKANQPIMVAQNTGDSLSIYAITETPFSTLTETKIPPLQLPTNTIIPPTTTRIFTPKIAPPTLTPTFSPKDRMPMVFVPAGEFIMGSSDSDADKNEKPEHAVYLNAFWINQFEVTNEQFQDFIEHTSFVTTAEIQGWSWVFGNGSTRVEGAFWAAPEGPGSHIDTRLDHPVVHISYSDALNYCKWAGGRLPTEAEWEKAARGTDKRIFPWGEDPVTGNKANFCDANCPMDWSNRLFDDGYQITAPAGTYPDSESVYGVMDMVGNVWEWVSDYYLWNYYESSPLSNPLGPDSGENYVIRGGSWVSEPQYLTCTTRYLSGADETSNDHGFRCVFDDLSSD